MEYTPKIPKFTTHNQLDLGTLWISTDYAQKNPPQTLYVIKKKLWVRGSLGRDVSSNCLTGIVPKKHSKYSW